MSWNRRQTFHTAVVVSPLGSRLDHLTWTTLTPVGSTKSISQLPGVPDEMIEVDCEGETPVSKAG